MGSALRPYTPHGAPNDMNGMRGHGSPQGRPINSIWPPREGSEQADPAAEAYQSPPWNDRAQLPHNNHHHMQGDGPAQTSASIERGPPVQSHAYRDDSLDDMSAEMLAEATKAIFGQEDRRFPHLQNVSAGTGRPLRHGNPQSSPGPDSVGLSNQEGPGAISLQQSAMEKRGPVEFNHAISYVNKIKVCKEEFGSH